MKCTNIHSVSLKNSKNGTISGTPLALSIYMDNPRTPSLILPDDLPRLGQLKKQSGKMIADRNLMILQQQQHYKLHKKQDKLGVKQKY